MKKSPLVTLSNSLTRMRHPKCAPERLLLLLPACLQSSECKQRIQGGDFSECQRCGKCQIRDMLELAEEYGVQPFIATGGRLAAEKARSGDVDAIVAVACTKELREGIMAVFPKPVLTIYNEQPNGPCLNTGVAVEKVREAIECLIK